MKPSQSRDTLGARMSDAWIALARSGSPEHAGVPSWPAYSTVERATMIFDRDDVHLEGDPCAAQRRVWSGVHVPMGIARD